MYATHSWSDRNHLPAETAVRQGERVAFTVARCSPSPPLSGRNANTCADHNPRCSPIIHTVSRGFPQSGRGGCGTHPHCLNQSPAANSDLSHSASQRTHNHGQILDTRDLSVTEAFTGAPGGAAAPAPFAFLGHRGPLGTPLRVVVPAAARSAEGVAEVTVRFETSPASSACQFLEPAQARLLPCTAPVCLTSCISTSSVFR